MLGTGRMNLDQEGQKEPGKAELATGYPNMSQSKLRIKILVSWKVYLLSSAT